MKKFVYHYLWQMVMLLSIATGNAYAQQKTKASDIPTVTPPSPHAASLGKYGDIPVSPYTGIPNISIPVYEIVSGDIKVPISISYHASGIKVNEEASRVGLGWTLNAGGLISRSIFGEDDFLYPKYFDTSLPEIPEGPADGPLNWVQRGNRPQFYKKGAADEASFATYSLDLSQHITTSSAYEFQPDQYSYNFNGYAGKFVLKRNKEVVLQKQDKIRIKFPDAEANKWEVVTADGFTYLFEIFETYTDTEFTTSGVPATHKSSWYLTKIISPTKKEVTFNYKKLSEQYIKPVGAYTERSQMVSVPVGSCTFSCPAEGESRESVPGKPYALVILESIDFDNGRLVFDYEAREDINGDKRLKHIQIFQKNKKGELISPEVKKFSFSYDYFVSSNDIDFTSDGPQNFVTKRLKLLSMQEVSPSNGKSFINPYEFRYYEGSNTLNLPSKNSFARDHWGYYNGKLSNTSLIPGYTASNSSNPVQKIMGNIGTQRNTDPNYVKAFSLKEIRYPTQGKTSFEYEAHTFDVKASRVRDNSFSGDAPTLESTSKEGYYNGENKGEVFEQELDLRNLYVDKNAITATVQVSGRVRLGTTCKEAPTGGGGDTFFALYDKNGLQVEQVYIGSMECGSGDSRVFTYTQSLNLAPGVYTWKAFVNRNNALVEDISATYTYLYERGMAENPNSPEAAVYDFAGGLRIKRIIDEDDVTGQKNVKKYVYHYEEDRNGDGTPEEYSFGKRMAVPQYSYFEFAQEKDEGIHCYCARLVRSSDSNIPLNGSAAGSVVGYDRVELLLGENGENGKTSFVFENYPDLVLNYFSDGFPMRPALVPNIPFEKNGMLLKQTDFANEKGTFNMVKEIININRSTGTRIVYGVEKRNHYKQEDITPNELDLYFYPSINSTRTFVSKTTEKIYSGSGVPFTRETEYFYENPEHLQPTKIVHTLNNGKKEITRIRYPADFSSEESDDVIVAMRGDQHMHSLPIQTLTLIEDKGVEKLIGLSVNEYNFFNSLILKESVRELEADQPLALREVPAYSFKGEIPEAYQEKLSYRYNEQGNIIEVRSNNQPTTSYLWAYSNALPIAEIKNASFTEVESALQMSPAIIFEDAGGETLDDASLRAKIDQLRARLPKAMISSYTYKPLEGISSFADPSGNISFFEYDDLGRLKVVKDHEGNIVKTYNYNYRVY
jgi:YD repeat-containing protein